MKRLPYLLMAIIGLGYFAILIYNAGFIGSIGVLLTYLVLGAGSMWGPTSRFIGETKSTESIILSFLFAPIPLGIGAWLSSVTQWFEARYIPAALGLVYSGWVLYSELIRSKNTRTDWNAFTGRIPTLYSWILGSLVLIPSLFVTLSSQKIGESAIKLYNDLPWQIAMTSETLVRPAKYFPFLSGVELSYPWTFHGFLGTLGSFTGISASTLVTQVWPIVFSFLLPLFVAFYAWRLTSNKWVTVLSPITLMFFVGPEVPFNEAIRFVLPYSISPTYEFGILALLSVLIFLSYGTPSSISGRISGLLIAMTLVFVASGSKGSNGLILVAVFAVYFAHSLLTKPHKRYAALITGMAGIGALGAYTMTISGDANSLNLNSLSFLTGATSLVSPLIFLMVALSWIVGSAWVIRHYEPEKFSAVLPSIAAFIAGVVCLGLFGHPGQSQIYFFWSVVPILVVLGLWAIQLLFAHFGPIVVIPLILAWGAGQVLDEQVSYFFIHDVYAKFKWFLLWGILLCSLLVIYSLRKPRQRITKQMALLLMASTAVVSMAAQPFSDVQKVFSGPASTTAIVTLTNDQMVGFNQVKLITVIDEVIATNHHCLTSVVIGDECDGRSTALSAFSERRVLVEGHYNVNSPEEMSRLKLNDEFIYSPTPENQQKMWDLGVRYVFVDKLIGIPVDLSNYGVLEFDSKDVQIWKLNPPVSQ